MKLPKLKKHKNILMLAEKSCLLVMFIFFSSYLYAQEKLIQIMPEKLEINALLKQLHEKEGISFMHSGLEEALSQKISLSPSKATLNDLLKQVSEKTGLSFQRSGNTIAIKKNGTIDKIGGMISGIVSNDSRIPMEGATVVLSPGNRTTYSNGEGRFEFKELPVGKYTVKVSYVGFTDLTETVKVSDNKLSRVELILTSADASNLLNPVVVTGQYRPQSLNKSIYRVEVITKRQIENQAVSNVAELLKQQLNIDIINDAGTGRSKIRVLGLNSQYTKILMDNIPIAGDENMGSDVDLSTISLDDVERVEIVKGAMGVEYGANSIGGVINIITKRRADKKTTLSVELQEETVRNEYNLFFDKRAKGRHIQRVNASHNLNEYLSIGGSASYDKFNGYWGEYDGAGLIKELIGQYPTNTRGYDWSPKTSFNTNIYVSYTKNGLSLFYKYNQFNSDLTNYGRLATMFELKDEQVLINAGVNNDYRNSRYNHHFNARGRFWKNGSFSLDASFQKNGLEHRRQAINLQNNKVLAAKNGIPGSNRLEATDWQKYNQSKGLYSKGNILKPVFHDKLDFNIGYELDYTTGNQGQTNWFNDVSLNQPVQQSMFSGSAYTSFEWTVSPKIMIRPGFRLNYNDKLKTRTNESITTRFKLNKNNDLRLIAGTSTRFPNYNELFMSFVDVIHEYVGNPDLRPEYGQSVELQWAHRREFAGDVHLETSLSTMFQHIKDRIVNVTYESDRNGVMTGKNTFTNENRYNGLQNQLSVNLVSTKFHFSIAGSVVGYKGSDDASVNDYGKFLLNTQGNAQVTYLLPLGFRVAAFYRYVGKQPLYVFIPKTINGIQTTEYYKILAETEDYHNLDMNIAKTFLKGKLDIRAGARNIADVRNISYAPVNLPANLQGTLGGQGTVRLYYGKSWFMKLTYHIFK
jgi:outer membrane receptor for ferrienterochelin and colicins